ncbi:C4-dicarboxylate transport system permease large protein [Oceanobacillus iheyensis HTE831]|uniref:C4-dicarboxylate transport system permease large protein n=1 Tax=Oceanobacillus iheyensis (strain DSM 14371 / CIP 107618 / JCM 11309 / KCTC 3954 / HTE831) TaxID=221109 RepID=Q8ELH2_OCEIH|nr:TRAP transporter large permease [Oceanobacillus iheyensis]BAC15211.1 C4-dicarboxylate transport system permease large protein [Oceanobacillus iheyensis HTE831]
MILVLVLSLIVLFIIGVPVAISLGLSSSLAILVAGDIPLLTLAQRAFVSLDSFPLLAIPLFILAGALMEYGGISQRLINLANAITGHVPGGLAIVTVVTTMFFAAISGSSVAATAALGAILIPAMINRGYDKEFAGGVQAVSGTLGIIIPPSIPLILYGTAVGASIGDLFIAGMVPGIIIGIGLVVTVYILAKKRNYLKEPKKSSKDIGKAFLEAIPALIMPIIILGGIYSGIFTATEAAGVAVAYAFIVSVFVYKAINKVNIKEILTQASVTTSTIMFILATAGLFSWILTIENIPQQVASLITSISDSPMVFLTIVILVLLLVGMFMETNASIIILAPILVPVAVELGLDPVHFGIVMIVTLAIGMVTPPLGLNLFVVSKIGKVRIDHLTKGLIPFYIAILISLIVITYIPSITMSLVEWMK